MSLSGLPEDVWLHTLSFLDPTLVTRFALVCRHSDQFAWRGITHLVNHNSIFDHLQLNQKVRNVRTLSLTSPTRLQSCRGLLLRSTKLSHLTICRNIQLVTEGLPVFGETLQYLEITYANGPDSTESMTSEDFLRAVAAHCPGLHTLRFLYPKLSTTAIGHIATLSKLQVLEIATSDWSPLKTHSRLTKLVINGPNEALHDFRDARKAIALQKAMNPPRIGFNAQFFDTFSGGDDFAAQIDLTHTLITNAIAYGPISAVEYLLGQLGPEGLALEVPTLYNDFHVTSTLLHTAADSERADMVRFLISMGADPLARRQPTGHTIFSSLLRYWSEEDGLLPWLFDEVLPEALARLGPTADVATLLAAEGEYLFMDYIVNGDPRPDREYLKLQRVLWLLEEPRRSRLGIDIDLPSPGWGCTALHCAEAQLIKPLIDLGARWDVVDYAGHTAVQCLARASHPSDSGENVWALLEAIPDDAFAEECTAIPFVAVAGDEMLDATKNLLARFLRVVPKDRWKEHFLTVIRVLAVLAVPSLAYLIGYEANGTQGKLLRKSPG